MGSKTLDLIMEENITETTTESVMVTDHTLTISVPAHGACIKFNQSDPFKIGDKYGGIPLNLLTNTIGWSVLIIMFIFIRKNIVKKMGLSLAENLMTKHWCSVFFGRDNDPSEEIEESETSENSFNDEDENEEEVNIREDLPDTVAENRAISIREEDLEASAPLESAVSSRRSSIKSKRILTFHEKRLLGMMGPDAVQYLRFQKYIIIYIFLTTIVSLGVILPLNFQGTQLGNATDFGHTTLANLNPNNDKDSYILWIHVAVAFLMFPAAIFLMRRFSIGLKMRDTSLKITRTLIIENIPKRVCTVDQVMQHFEETYPDFKLFDVQLGYNVNKVTTLAEELQNVVDSRKFSEAYLDVNKEELLMTPVAGARCCRCFCLPCVNKVSCTKYFSEQEVILREKLKKGCEEAFISPIGMAFVTFHNINHARAVFRDHKYSILNHFKFKPPESTVSMDPDKWRVRYAPPPSDIIWQNLSDGREWVTCRKFFANLFIFIVAFFLTTPQLVVHQLDPILNALKNITGEISRNPNSKTGNSTSPTGWEDIKALPAWLTDFLPTLAIWTFTALLPVVIAYADRLVGHSTRSGENHAIMKKTFWYLLFMVIVLPTFGFTSAQAYLENLINNKDLNWECIFLPDSGAFFVNYVITAAMIGSGLELIRFPDLFWYLIQICLSRSKADTPAIRKAIRYEFRFGEQYARMMLIFAMVVMFSISCPLITPFGCLYFVLKHFVDRHNLAFVYERSRINKKVHATAIHFVIMSVAFLQFFMIVFSVIRSLDDSFKAFSPKTKVAIGLFFLTLNVCSSHIWANTCRKISPIKYEDVLLGYDEEDEHTEPYIPEVLRELVLKNDKSRSVMRSVSWRRRENMGGYSTF